MNIGTIRRIDNLGRIVIPKEIRKVLKIKNGDNLEIFIKQDNIIMKKYSQLTKMIDIGKIIIEILKETINGDIFITDKDKIILTSGKNLEKYNDKELSEELENILNNRQMIIKENSYINLTGSTKEKTNYIIKPIIEKGDLYGSLIMLTKEKIDEIKINSVNMLSRLLTKNIE